MKECVKVVFLLWLIIYESLKNINVNICDGSSFSLYIYILHIKNVFKNSPLRVTFSLSTKSSENISSI